MNRPILIIGAGTLGVDLALDFASHNIPVILKDIDSSALTRAKERMRALLRLMIFKYRRRNADVTFDGLCALVTFTPEPGEIDFIIENITEDIEKKHKSYEALGKTFH